MTGNRKHEFLREGAFVRITDEYHFISGWAQTRRAGHRVNEFEASHRLYRRAVA